MGKFPQFTHSVREVSPCARTQSTLELLNVFHYNDLLACLALASHLLRPAHEHADTLVPPAPGDSGRKLHAVA